MKEINKPSDLKAQLQGMGVRANPKLGQNFLFDQNVLGYVAESSGLKAGDVALEIGTGAGTLTTFLAATGAEVVTVEIDGHMFEIAQQRLGVISNLTMLNTDVLERKNLINPEVVAVLKSKLEERPGARFLIVSAFPYAVAAPIMMNFLEGHWPLATICGIVQHELGARLAGAPGTSDYGALSVSVQATCKVEYLRKLGKNLFWPPPSVHSCIVRMQVIPPAERAFKDSADFFHFVRGIFSTRRKSLRNCLKVFLGDRFSESRHAEYLSSRAVDENFRPEQFTPEQIIDLYHFWCGGIKIAEDIIP